MSKDLESMADRVVQQIKTYVQRNSISRIEALEQRVVELEERLRAIDGRKAHIPNSRGGYITKVM